MDIFGDVLKNYCKLHYFFSASYLIFLVSIIDKRIKYFPMIMSFSCFFFQLQLSNKQLLSFYSQNFLDNKLLYFLRTPIFIRDSLILGEWYFHVWPSLTGVLERTLLTNIFTFRMAKTICRPEERLFRRSFC